LSIIDGELDEFAKLINGQTPNNVKSHLKQFLPKLKTL